MPQVKIAITQASGALLDTFTVESSAFTEGDQGAADLAHDVRECVNRYYSTQDFLNGDDPFTTVIDFGVLLKKYMQHVRECEGVAFIADEESGALLSDVTFTPAEMAALEGLLNEIRNKA